MFADVVNETVKTLDGFVELCHFFCEYLTKFLQSWEVFWRVMEKVVFTVAKTILAKNSFCQHK